MSLFVDRMIRAAKLDVHLYEEVEADRRSMGQAMGVVLLSSLAGGIGFMQEAGLMGLVIGTVGSLLGWYVWAFMTYLIGTKLLPEPQTHADHGELLRTIGFSSAPGLIRVFGIFPALSGFVNLLAGVWMLVAMVIAVRQALDYQSTYRAIGVCLIGWIIQAILLALLVTTMGGVPELMLEQP
ncbi:MAG TPA: YIP1 family protein [Nitrospirales bacterium]|nr:YIP1 family protein [Nitrospirales bacterium]